ncbi:MAG: hypothetical protein R2727_10215 [Bacteroidales bacterium]
MEYSLWPASVRCGRTRDVPSCDKKAIKDALSEVSQIVSSYEEPGFDNTIVALERIGRKVDDIASLLFNLNMAETGEELQAVAREVSPLLTRFSNQVTLNPGLYEKIARAASGSPY